MKLKEFLLEAEKNPMGKMRKKEDPYEIYQSDDGWEFRVLKKYQSPEKEKTNPYARWMVAVQSPNTFGGWDIGDSYVKDIFAHRGLKKVK